MIKKYIITFLVIAWHCAQVQADWQPVSKVGIKKPISFELKNLDGNLIDLKRYKGQIVLVNFWATWCEPCRDEFSELTFLQEKYRSKGLVVLAVNLAESKSRI